MEFLYNLSITEILSSWELQGKSVQAALTASNILVILYAITARKINQGCFFVAFFLDEILSNLSIVADSLNEYQYYLMIASIYCILFWYIESKNMKLKTIVACGTIILFNAGMSIDAIINKEAYSYIYENYLLIIVFLHLYFLSTLFSWTIIRSAMGEYLRGWRGIIGANYNFTFICYSIFKEKTPSE